MSDIFKDHTTALFLGVFPMLIFMYMFVYGIFITGAAIIGRMMWILRPLFFLTVWLWWKSIYIFALGFLATGVLAFMGYTKPIAWVCIAFIQIFWMTPLHVIGYVYGIQA